MKKLMLILVIPGIILLLSLAGAVFISKNKPEAKHRPAPSSTPLVEVVAFKKQDFQVWLHTQGVIKPRIQSTLIPEVSGKVIQVAPNFRDGGFFEAGESLVKIDSRDYESAIIIAESELAKTSMEFEDLKGQRVNYQTTLHILESDLSDARVNLEEEAARSDLAAKNWEELGKKGIPGPLLLRTPQLTAAQSRVEAVEAKLAQAKNELNLFEFRLKAFEAQIRVAQAKLEQKKIDLERTNIRAPYAGRIMQKQVDMGQYVSPGSTLAHIYAVDFVEIRLPLRDDQLEMVRLPEVFRGNIEERKSKKPEVRVYSDYGGQVFTWTGKLVRTEGVVDPQSQQLFAVARINNPFIKKEDQMRPPLKIGQFVQAEIKGHFLKDVIVIPASALRAGSTILVVDENNFVHLRKVRLIWRQEDKAIISAELKEKERLSITSLIYGGSTKPFKVNIKGEERENYGKGNGESK